MTRELTKDDVGKTFKDGFHDKWRIVAFDEEDPKWPIIGKINNSAPVTFNTKGERCGFPQRQPLFSLIIEDPPREVWVNFYPYGWPPVAHKTKEKADEAAESDRIGPAVLFREVKS